MVLVRGGGWECGNCISGFVVDGVCSDGCGRGVEMMVVALVVLVLVNMLVLCCRWCQC